MAHWRGWAGRGTRATTSTRGPTPWPPSTSATRRTCTASSSKTRKPTKSCRWPPDWRECWMCGNQTTMELSKQEKPYKSKRKNSCCDWKRSLGEIFKYYNRKLADRIPIPKNVWRMVFAERLYFHFVVGFLKFQFHYAPEYIILHLLSTFKTHGGSVLNVKKGVLMDSNFMMKIFNIKRNFFLVVLQMCKW